MKKAFTLIELMVSITILALVLVMLSGMVNYTSGRLKSAQLKLVNDSLRQSLDLISQKMYNANDKKTIGVLGEVKGFTVNNSNILIIVSSNLTDNKIVCTYFGQKGDKLAMTQDATCPAEPNDLDHFVTPSKINITDFSLIEDQTGNIPNVVISLSGYNTTDKDKVAATVKTTLTMDGENVRNLNP
jgi:prepilin-type N-terminal cleavage/methylation domain-containing protein